MAHSRSKSQPSARKIHAVAHSPAAPPTVSARWLLTALGAAIPAALICTWGALCLLFWQGSWQLLYHPAVTVAHTPSEAGLAYDPVSFATTDAGVAQLQGWWIPAPAAHYTALYLHDRAGNLGDTIDTLAEIHAAGVNVMAFDYRGYGQSHFAHPSEVRWLQDASLFLCPCHGGVFDKNGAVAGGPPQEPLPQFDVRVNNGQVEVLAGSSPLPGH